MFEKGGVKGTWDQFKNRFSFGGQVVTQQEIVFVRMQPFTGNKFGTQNPVEYFSDRYQQLLSIRFYGLYDVKIADPVLFYVSAVSHQVTADKPFTLEDVAQGTLRQTSLQKLPSPFQNIRLKIRRIFTISMQIKTFSMKSQNAKSTKRGQNYMVLN